MPLLTYREAAKRVHRSRRTIRHWRMQGMPMMWALRDGQRVRVVELRVLLSWWRQKLKNDPIVQQRIRAEKRREEAAHDTPGAT
ncbi:hypothetical protein CSIV_05025 [Microbacterium sp. CSI-V]|nr:hypothetical protein CSIV_05025 [Microbacterium sp. CSI-V]